MCHIVRQFALTVAFTAGLYGILLGISYLVVPPLPHRGWMDAWDTEGSLLSTAPKYVYLGRGELDVTEPKVLLIGASNTGVGLRRKDVQVLLPCAKVSNLALGGANISELRQIADLVRQAQSPRARQSNVFVLGIWFGMFTNTDQNWPAHPLDTDLDVERYRYGFERRSANGPVALVPASWLSRAVVLIRPYLLLERVARDMSSSLRTGLFNKAMVLDEAETEKRSLDQAGKTQTVAMWRQLMGPRNEIAQTQVGILRALIEELLNAGNKVVLVDMPVAPWFTAATPWEPSYVRALEVTIGRFAGRPGFKVMRTDDLRADEGFTDEVHPKPHLARALAARLATRLGPGICKGAEATRQTGVSASRAAL